MINVLLVDDHPLVAQGLSSLISSDDRIHLVGRAASLAEAKSIAPLVHAHVVLLDLKLPDATGVEAIGAIKSWFPFAKILVLTGRGEKARLPSLEAGADAFLSKEAASGAVLQLICSIADVSHPLPPSRLSKKEDEVARMAAQGMSNQEIAEAMGLSINTIKTHMASILNKLGLRDRVALVKTHRDLQK
jgi:DNA-binding NarL/FixJ family response regulator